MTAKYSKPEIATIRNHSGAKYVQYQGTMQGWFIGAEIPADLKNEKNILWREDDAYEGLAIELQMPNGSWKRVGTEFVGKTIVEVG